NVARHEVADGPGLDSVEPRRRQARQFISLSRLTVGLGGLLHLLAEAGLPVLLAHTTPPSASNSSLTSLIPGGSCRILRARPAPRTWAGIAAAPRLPASSASKASTTSPARSNHSTQSGRNEEAPGTATACKSASRRERPSITPSAT